MNFFNIIKSILLIFLSLLISISSKYINIFIFLTFIPIFISFYKFPKISKFTFALYFIGYFFIYEAYLLPLIHQLIFLIIIILIFSATNILLAKTEFKYMLIIISANIIIFDYILYNLWGTLFIFSSNIGNEYLLKISTYLGPQTILAISLTFSTLIVYNINKKQIIKPCASYVLTISFIIIFGYISNFTYNKFLNFFIINFNNKKEAKYIELTNKSLSFIEKKSLKNSIILLPSINIAFNNDTEKKFFELWGNISKKYSADLTLGCKDLFFNYNVAPLFSQNGNVVEISEQKQFFPITNIDKGEYTLFIEKIKSNIGILVNEEIFFKKPADFLTKTGSHIIINPQKNITWLKNNRIINSLKLNAIINRQSIISNFYNKLIIAIDANGHLIFTKDNFNKYPVKIIKIKLPEGKSFSRYQQWGDLLPYSAFIILFLLIIQKLYKTKSFF